MTDRSVWPCLRAGSRSGLMDRMVSAIGKSANAATMGETHRDGPNRPAVPAGRFWAPMDRMTEWSRQVRECGHDGREPS
jgi:hypothetical protein